jgi:hypothetical protein
VACADAVGVKRIEIRNAVINVALSLPKATSWFT